MNTRSVEEYLKLPYTIEIIREEDEENPGWVARVVELNGCITQADTFEELGEMIEDAMRVWIEVAQEDVRALMDQVGLAPLQGVDDLPEGPDAPPHEDHLPLETVDVLDDRCRGVLEHSLLESLDHLTDGLQDDEISVHYGVD